MTNNRKQADTHSDFAFFEYLRLFYRQNRKEIRNHYKLLSKKFLDFNDSANVKAFLRTPQFEALETYIFLKEFLDNAPVHRIFEDWHKKSGKFAQRAETGTLEGQEDLFGILDENRYNQIFSKMQNTSRIYPNYIFALTMGTGKTILMATCIFYEFLLSNKCPDDPRYCHNALVFAPDKTVLQSLKEIQTFDKSRVVPPEYVNWLDIHLQFHFLEEAGTTLNTLDRSRYNIIISNT
jgi:type III restriction enzyme